MVSILSQIQQNINDNLSSKPESPLLDRVEMENRVRIHKWKGHSCPYNSTGKCSNTAIRCGERFQFNIPESTIDNDKIHLCNHTSMLVLNEINVLIVDDEKNLTEIASLFLNELGFKNSQITIAQSVNEAKQHLDQGKLNNKTYSLILSDILMPNENGYDLVNYVIERNFNSRIVLMSGYYSEEAKASSYLGDSELFPGAKPVIDFIKKPFSLEDFKNIIHKLEFVFASLN